MKNTHPLLESDRCHAFAVTKKYDSGFQSENLPANYYFFFCCM